MVTPPENREQKTEENSREPSAARPYEADFDALWALYPRKVDKGAGYKAYVSRRRQGIDHERLLLSVKHYAEACDGQDRQFVKHCATFLNRDGAWVEWEHGRPDSGPMNGGPKPDRSPAWVAE